MRTLAGAILVAAWLAGCTAPREGAGPDDAVSAPAAVPPPARNLDPSPFPDEANEPFPGPIVVTWGYELPDWQAELRIDEMRIRLRVPEVPPDTFDHRRHDPVTVYEQGIDHRQYRIIRGNLVRSGIRALRREAYADVPNRNFVVPVPEGKRPLGRYGGTKDGWTITYRDGQTAKRLSNGYLGPFQMALDSLAKIDEGVAPGVAEHLEVPLGWLRNQARRRILEE